MDEPTWHVRRQRLTDLVTDLDGRILVAIGVGSGAEARRLHHTLCDLRDAGAVPDYVGGFVFFVSGYLCAAARGLPDLGLVLRSEIVAQTDMIEQATWLAALDRGTDAFPIGVDVDTGYGNEPAAVLLTCRQVHKQGGSYVQIEDQYAINKSCGHMAGARGAGKTVIDADEMIATRLAPALSYAAEQDDFLVLARTDALGVAGIDEALRRAHAYAEAGAQLVAVEAPETDEQLARIAAELAGTGVVNVANMVEGGGRTPYKTPRELHELGYQMALYSIGAPLAAQAAMKRYYASLAGGENVAEAGSGPPAGAFPELNRTLGRSQTEAWNLLFAEQV